MRKHTSPHDRHFFPYYIGTKCPKESEYYTVRALRHGENGERSASLPEDYTTLKGTCQELFKLFSKILQNVKIQSLKIRFLRIFYPSVRRDLTTTFEDCRKCTIRYDTNFKKF